MSLEADGFRRTSPMSQRIRQKFQEIVKSKEGAIGYLAAWLLGVPASVLAVVFLLRGCD
jgi:hypothetical protein